jgi:hypothetical protein
MYEFATAAPKVTRRHPPSPARSHRAPLVRDVLADPGRPLDRDVGERMGSRFGHDFSRVRVHADASAAQSAATLSAHAYTIGHHIVFGADRYRPGSEEGDRLIAHELTHVLQQGEVGDTLADVIVLDAPGNSHDVEASKIAGNVMNPSRAPARRPDPVATPVATTRLHRPPNTVVVQRALLGGIVGAGIGGLVGGLAGLAIGGPIGAIIGGVLGAVVGGLIGGLMSPFPSYREIVGDADVRARTGAAWASMLAATTPASRREEGFWIRLNKGTGKYEFTPTILGPVIGPLATGSVVLGARPADVAPGTPGAIYTVASFHTHTPTTFRPVGRPVGPSGPDNAADTSDDVVGVVYDYVGSPAGSLNIPAGHPLASAAQLYHSGPDHRQRE